MNLNIRSFFILLLIPLVLPAQTRRLHFGEPVLDFQVKESVRPRPPGPNLWSDSSRLVFLDSLKQLHLQTRRLPHRWRCAEVSTQKNRGYGTYTFYVTGNPAHFHRRLICGLFLYENDNSEIDIEFSRWGQRGNFTYLTYSIYSKDSAGEKRHFSKKIKLKLTGDSPHTTHQIIWTPDSIRFVSYYGHYPAPPRPGLLIADVAVMANQFPLPVAGLKKLAMNLFWHRGRGTSRSFPGEYEIVIDRFKFAPLKASPLR